MGKEVAKEDSSEHSISSSRRSARTVSVTVPTIPKPDLSRVSAEPKFRYGLLALAFILVAFLSGIAGAWVQTTQSSTQTVTGNLSVQKKVVSSQSQLISQISKTVGPSVVSVNVSITSDTNNSYGIFGFSQPSSSQAAGTGIILSKSGIVITNRHVVPEGTTSVSVTLSDGTELKNVTVIGRTNSTDSLDIAFLKINDTKDHELTPAVLGDSSSMQVGDNVVAIGNALGQFQNTVTSGIISGYGRSVQAGSGDYNDEAESLEDLLQTDAAINQGNSGGPLVNLNGQVIGINTAVAGNSQNIGFAIPINDVRGLVDQVLKKGSFERAYLGIRYVPITADIASAYDLKVTTGAYIPPTADAAYPTVFPDSPAQKAGIQPGDVITQINGNAVDQTHSVSSYLYQYKPGDTVSLTIVRDGKTITAKATLSSVPKN